MNTEQNSPKYKYEIAIKARNFHYDNFSKWSTYFYVAIGAIFIGYCTVSTEGYKDNDKEFLKIGLLLLGYSCSILWHMSNKGYYFWALNFIKIINYYEKKISGDDNNERVYSILAYKEQNIDVLFPNHAANYSTSKISLVFSYIISFSWGILFFYKILAILPTSSICIAIGCCIFLNPLIIAIISIIGKYCLESKVQQMSYIEN
ncbi:hypothetical protein SAMN04488511_1095 [Pedobacter suwonensis]|uniref:Uncharacterized protein n=1 Tax=Pedobacter suwonensis TaxID=332999 RepID=A0A1I0TEQ3_9SPHI|nr:hypothetical protein [Pedobacter suwonensis]SFA50177.1 hypothetical protein SAMN04488511_1095 [Pedobacter suwonensis]